MDEATRERYRRACQEVAAWSGRTPSEAAHEALRLSEEHDAGEPRGRHVGAWLLAEGRARLEASLGCKLPWRARAARFARRHSQGLYVGSLLLVTALLALGIERLLATRGMQPLHRLLLVAILAPQVLDLLQERFELLASRLVRHLEPLPRLEPERVFSPDTRTLVVTPLLVASAEDIDSQLRMMEINYLGNVEPELFFALLTDFRDAPEKDMPADGGLRERLERGLRELNERHGYREQPRFFYLHRERRWNPVARRWMGWERKRGKLEELNRLVLGAEDTSYTGPVPGVVRTVRYVLTLDADTHLLPGAAARLVATLHHPLNRARFDAAGKRVVAGYSMLQPAIADGPTKAAWLSTGGWPLSIARNKRDPRTGMDPAAVHQFLFGSGTFVGKGLYDVAAFARSLEGRLPENFILSHDRIEGMFARVGYVSDVRLFERSPATMASQARIWHRWTRGDWQVLPWLLPWVPSQHGLVRNTLPMFDRWALLSAMRGSLAHPLSFCLLAFGWLCLPASSAGAWTLGAMLWNCRSLLIMGSVDALRAVWRSPSFASLGFVVAQVGRMSLGVVMNHTILLPTTGLMLDAIGRALYGLVFDRSRMLDWTTHAQSSRQGGGLRHLLTLPEVWGALVLALGVGGALAVSNPGALPWACPLLLLWLPHPVMHLLRREPGSAPGVRESPDAERLRTLARGFWELYVRSEEGRTELSPTDLSLGLVAPLSAYHLGYVGLEGLVSRLDESLSVIAGLERHRGHLFERYEARERRPLGPRRISTAESGVLAASLVIVERGLQASRMVCTDEALRVRLGEAEARARALREELDFSFLYDGEAGLFHTGYDAGSGALEGAHHGLLTSGAMLAGFVAIARRQVPLRHWLALTASDQRLRAEGAISLPHDALAEHLLPTLFLWFPPASLLGQAALDAVNAGNGAPQLPAPALRFRPERVAADLQRLADTRTGGARDQAMALAAVANLTCDDILVQHFHRHWQTAWVEGLVYETKDLQ
ncbi:glycosyltransferase family 2 protein [Archangium gephyra]|uniref:hypothetical protein n=1 Tax=Archangium gephyra TaxID=48 RepID=UPI0035D42975